MKKKTKKQELVARPHLLSLVFCLQEKKAFNQWSTPLKIL